MRLILSLSALAATFAIATPALAVTTTPAQTSATADAYGVVLQPLTLTKIKDLNFGTVISGLTAGNVTIDATTSLRAVSGGVTAVSNYPGFRAEFRGAGQEGQVVLLAISAPVKLLSATNVPLTVNSLSLDSGGASRTIDSTQVFTVGVGGDFAIAANQANGLYTASFTVTADYQ